MNSTLIKLTTITAISAAAVFGLAACSSGSGANTNSSTDSSSMPQMIGPVVVEFSALEGTDQSVTVGQMIDITTGTEDPAKFTAVIADTKVASFTAGGKNGTSTSNPGVTGVTAGTTKVALTDSNTGTVYNFTVTVK